MMSSLLLANIGRRDFGGVFFGGRSVGFCCVRGFSFGGLASRRSRPTMAFPPLLTRSLSGLRRLYTILSYGEISVKFVNLSKITSNYSKTKENE
jgi:hypothetical protein